jgi:hypothetical protein
MTAAVAWIVPLPGNMWVAVGNLEFVHVLPDVPVRTAVTKAPAFMREAVSWNGGLIPVFDAGKLSQGIEMTSDSVYYGVVRFRPISSSRQQFGALKMSAIPQRVSVDDGMACDLPDSHQCWRQFSVSCFSLDGHPVPVLDLARVFAQAPDHLDAARTASAIAGDADAPEEPNPSNHDGYPDFLAAT